MNGLPNDFFINMNKDYPMRNLCSISISQLQRANRKHLVELLCGNR
jgi:hypothetical protein